MFYEPTNGCRIKGNLSDWKGLPASKSLFCASEGCGLPIGNLTSQVFANFYMNEFDHFMKHTLRLRYYGRYVDDFIIIHNDKEYLKELIPVIREFLETKLFLRLHPRKIFMQHYTKGVKYLGVVIKPYRKYVANRTFGNMYERIIELNKIEYKKTPERKDKRLFQSSINSYLGIMRHYSTYNKCKKIFDKKLSVWWKKQIQIDIFYRKIKFRKLT